MTHDYFTINGRAFPAVEPWTVEEGDPVRVRIVDISSLVHPPHLLGHDFAVVADDGQPVRPEAQQTVNTLPIDAGETYDVVFRADSPGYLGLAPPRAAPHRARRRRAGRPDPGDRVRGRGASSRSRCHRRRDVHHGRPHAGHQALGEPMATSTKADQELQFGLTAVLPAR
jgi:hypothetical protein